MRSEAVQIDLSSATVSQPAQDVAHAAHDNLIRLDDNTLVDIGMTQETLDTLTAEVIREFASGPRIEADPAQETATFAQLLRAALGPKTMAAIVYFANRIGWSSVNAGRRRWAPYARKSRPRPGGDTATSAGYVNESAARARQSALACCNRWYCAHVLQSVTRGARVARAGRQGERISPLQRIQGPGRAPTRVASDIAHGCAMATRQCQ